MTDGECLKKYIDLSDSDITEIEKRNLHKLLYKYKKAFSLRDEIGLCQSMEVELELKDESPFFIRPFPIKKSDKDIVEQPRDDQRFDQDTEVAKQLSLDCSAAFQKQKDNQPHSTQNTETGKVTQPE